MDSLTLTKSGKKITLKVARIKKEFTQEEVAEILGVTSTSIGNWENGKSRPSWKNLVKLMDLYDIDSIDDIIFLP